MNTTLNIAFAVYFATLLICAANFVVPRVLLQRAAMSLLVVGWGIHTAYISWRWVAAGRAPMSNQFESLVVMGWCIALLFLLLQLNKKSPLNDYGFWFILAIVITLGGASLFDSSIRPLMPALQSNWLFIHVVITILGYASFALAAVLGFIHIIGFRNKPSAKRALALDDFMFRTVSLGSLLLALGIITGSVWANSAWGTYWSWDPKETWSLITWFVYVTAIHLYKTKKWRGTRFAWCAVIGFVFVLFTYFGVNYLLAGLHSYA